MFVEQFGANIVPSVDAEIPKASYKVNGTHATVAYYTHLNEPAASTTTSSSLSESLVMSEPTTFLPCSNLRVDGSFCMRFETATHAHLRSAASALSICVNVIMNAQ